MATNRINWGKIYNSTWWGSGVINTISWGIVYYNNKVRKDFVDRVLADGGKIENSMCINII